MCVVSIDGVSPLQIPAALLAAHTLLQLGPLLDVAKARRAMEWAAIAAGGVAASGAMQFPPSSRDAAGVATLLTASVAVSLYALGFAAWTAPVGDGRPSRRLRASVPLWWAALGLIGANAAFHGDGPLLAFVLPGAAAGFVAFVILVHDHLLIAGALEQLAEEAEPAPTPV
jgi:hypothetical protein